VGGGRRVEVENEYGVAFTYHGEHPTLWTVRLHLYPLFPLRKSAAGRVQPLVLLGIGGLPVSVDLDNINDQTLYHSWQWSVGGGLRILLNPAAAFDTTVSFVELRLVRHRVWENGPLHGFDAVAATLGLGVRI
jgi:hypothetical protein